jgi:phosphate/sulfate permease
MSRPFTIVGAIILLAVAAAHVFRIAAGVAVMVGSHDVPMVVSWIAAAIAAFVGMMTIIELRR